VLDKEAYLKFYMGSKNISCDWKEFYPLFLSIGKRQNEFENGESQLNLILSTIVIVYSPAVKVIPGVKVTPGVKITPVTYCSRENARPLKPFLL